MLTSFIGNIYVYKERENKEINPFHIYNVMAEIFLFQRPWILSIFLITFNINSEKVPKCDG